MVNLFVAGFTVPTDPAFYVAVLGVIAMGYLYIRAKGKSRMIRTPTRNPTPPFSTAQKKVENQMTELIVELEKMMRQMNARLDTRAAKLEELILQADERLAAMDERLNELRSREGDALRLPRTGTRGSAEPVSHEELPPAPIPINPAHAAVYRLADLGRSPMEIARETNQPPGEVELILALRRRAR